MDNDDHKKTTQYLFLDEKIKLKLVNKIKKQITKFDLPKEELGTIIDWRTVS